MDATELVTRALDRDYWRELCPDYPIGAVAPGEPPPAVPPGDEETRLREHVRVHGWGQWPTGIGPERRTRVKALMERVAAAGWLPTFAFLYDEMWLIPREAGVRSLVQAALEPEARLLPDFWAYLVPTRAGGHGYRPHREAAGPLLRPDGTPVSITTWLPITDATLDNGCMYVLPMDLEVERTPEAELNRVYGAEHRVEMALHRARALPAAAGTALCWNHRVMHWGSFVNEQATHPRMSVAFEFIRSDVNAALHPHARITDDDVLSPPLLLSPTGPLPAFEQRLHLVGRQLDRYLERGGPDHAFIAVGQALRAGRSSRRFSKIRNAGITR